MTRSAAGPFPGQPAADGSKRWDARLAALLARPLVRTRVDPNHLTTLSLITGLAAALYGTADRKAANRGGALFAECSRRAEPFPPTLPPATHCCHGGLDGT